MLDLEEKTERTFVLFRNENTIYRIINWSTSNNEASARVLREIAESIRFLELPDPVVLGKNSEHLKKFSIDLHNAYTRRDTLLFAALLISKAEQRYFIQSSIKDKFVRDYLLDYSDRSSLDSLSLDSFKRNLNLGEANGIVWSEIEFVGFEYMIDRSITNVIDVNFYYQFKFKDEIYISNEINITLLPERCAIQAISKSSQPFHKM